MINPKEAEEGQAALQTTVRIFILVVWAIIASFDANGALKYGLLKTLGIETGGLIAETHDLS